MRAKKVNLWNKTLSSKDGTHYLLADIIGNLEELQELQTLIVQFVNSKKD